VTIDRRSLLKCAVLAPVANAMPRLAFAADEATAEKADYTLRIASGLIELSPKHIVSTTLYNGQFPGPLVRLQEGKRVVVDVFNETDTPELLHWHGQMIPSDVDGAAEEGSPFIRPHGTRRIAYVPKPSGFRFYHTHVAAGGDLGRSTYTAQAGPVYIEPASNPGAYDREVFLVLKEFEPSFSRGGDMAMDMLTGAPLKELQEIGEEAEKEFKGPKGYEVGYELFGINGKMLGEGEPVRVKEGERVLFHVLNASAGEIRSLALPGHVFKVVALDGNPVPTTANVPVLWLGTAERISAIVDMNHPGVWVMGDLADDDRRRGTGIVLEYSGRNGKPQWLKPKPFRWDYTQFGKSNGTPAPPDETLEMTIVKQNGALGGFNKWTLNGEAFSMETMKPMYSVREGLRYRLKFRNASDDIHPLHLHRHASNLCASAASRRRA
jgi:FtsP/CotA-like multicopper oxidase with cupredoxin domain